MKTQFKMEASKLASALQAMTNPIHILMQFGIDPRTINSDLREKSEEANQIGKFCIKQDTGTQFIWLFPFRQEKLIIQVDEDEGLSVWFQTGLKAHKTHYRF